jgi:hypothetical protein
MKKLILAAALAVSGLAVAQSFVPMPPIVTPPIVVVPPPIHILPIIDPPPPPPPPLLIVIDPVPVIPCHFENDGCMPPQAPKVD